MTSIVGILEQIIQNHQAVEQSFPDVEVLPEEDESGNITHPKGILIDVQTANAMLIVYKALSTEHQERAKKMMESFAGFEKFNKFAWSQVRY